MLRFASVLVGFLFMAAIPVRAQDAPFMPKSPPPSFGFVHALNAEKGLITVLYPVAKQVAETAYKTERREKDGQVFEVKVPYTITRMVMEVALTEWSPKSSKASDGSGKPIAEAEFWKRVRKGDTVLMIQGEVIDPAFLKIMQSEAVILHSPPPSGPVPAPGPPVVPAKKKDLSEIEEQVLELVNAQRKQAGVAALKPHELLMKAARAHSENMARQNVLAHELDGKGPSERVRELGYKSFGAAENCAAGQRTPAQVMESWLSSEGHRANILNGGYTEIGIGMAKTAGGMCYWTLVFSTPG